MTSTLEVGIRTEISPVSLLGDLSVAIGHANEIGGFERWMLKQEGCAEFFDRIKDDPSAADKVLAVDGLASLLKSDVEKKRIAEIIEESQGLNLGRFLGRRIEVEGSVGSIRTLGENPNLGYTSTFGVVSEKATYARGEIESVRPSQARIDLLNPRRLASILFAQPYHHQIFPYNEAGDQVVHITGLR